MTEQRERDEKPIKITKAFTKHVYKQFNKSILQLVKTSYENGYSDAMKANKALTARCEKLEAVLKHISSDEVSCPLCRAGALDMADHYAGIAKEAIEAVEDL